jgi:hypothetical protein
MRRGAGVQLMAQKMLFCFTNISAEILLNSFRLQLLCQAPYFGTFLPNGVVIKFIRNYLRKSCSALELKMLVRLTLLKNAVIENNVGDVVGKNQPMTSLVELSVAQENISTQNNKWRRRK